MAHSVQDCCKILNVHGIKSLGVKWPFLVWYLAGGGWVDALFFQRVLYIYLICIDSVQICQHMWWWANANLWLFINNITAVHSPIIFLQQSSRKSVFSVYYNFLRDVGAEFFLCPDEIPVWITKYLVKVTWFLSYFHFWSNKSCALSLLQ